MAALDIYDSNQQNENGEQNEPIESKVSTQLDQLKQILGNKDKNGQVSNYINSQFNEAGIILSELIQFDNETINEIIDEITLNIPKHIYRFPKVLCLTLKREIKSLQTQHQQPQQQQNSNTIAIAENKCKIDNTMQYNQINEIAVFLSENNLEHLKYVFEHNKTKLKVSHLITLYENQQLDQLCFECGISFLDITSLKTALKPIAQSIDHIQSNVKQLEMMDQINKTNHEFKQSTANEPAGSTKKTYTLSVKTCILGDSRVGKSSLSIQFVKNEFDQYKFPTIGATFLTQSISYGDALIQFEIWDTAGQTKYRSLAPLYTRGACVVIIVYDITNRESFHAANVWLESIRTQQMYHETIVAMVGNKTDLKENREVTLNECQLRFKNKVQIIMETSAKNNENVKDLFKQIAGYLDFVKLKAYTKKEQKRKGTKNRIIVDDVAVEMQNIIIVEDEPSSKKCCVI